MVREELQQKKLGVLECRTIVIKTNFSERKENYYLVNGTNNKYFISFSEDGTAGRSFFNEETMLKLLNDESLSTKEAFDIYSQTPQLNCWMDT